MRILVAAIFAVPLMVPAGLVTGSGVSLSRSAPKTASTRATSATDPFLGLSIDELRARMGPPDAIAGYELFSWFSRSETFPPDQWEAASGRFLARADIYHRKTAGNELKYEFLLRPDIRQSRTNPTLRITEYSVTFVKPVRLRDLLSIVTELKVVAGEPAVAYEGRPTAKYNRNSIVVQNETEATAAIANGFWEEEEDERGDPAAKPKPYGPQYQFWFAGDLGLFAATGDSLVERVTAGVGPVGLPAKDDRNRPGEVRELRTLGAFFAK